MKPAFVCPLNLSQTNKQLATCGNTSNCNEVWQKEVWLGKWGWAVTSEEVEQVSLRHELGDDVVGHGIRADSEE